MHMDEYQTAAMKTASSVLRPEKIDAEDLRQAFATVATLARALDVLKKGLVYGKDVPADGAIRELCRAITPERAGAADADTVVVDFDAVPADVTHAILGITTEAGELIEAWLDAVTGRKPLDLVNVGEEIGDVLWYSALACRGTGTTLEQTAALNIDKLARRYGGAFSEQRALTRDLDAERALLERGSTPKP